MVSRPKCNRAGVVRPTGPIEPKADPKSAEQDKLEACVSLSGSESCGRASVNQ